jgi:hypothetical protein
MPLNAILDDLRGKTAGAVFRADASPEGLPKGVFTFSKAMLKLKTTKDGEYFSRPMWVETAFDLE